MDTLITEVVANWGAFGIILACALYIIYDYIKSAKSRAEQHDDDLKTITKSIEHKFSDLEEGLNDRFIKIETKITKLSDKIIDEIQDIDSKEEHMDIQNLVKIGPKLHSVLQNYKQLIGIDHIFMGSFHNGISSITGIPYYKFDIIAERFNPEDNLQDIEFAPRYKNVDLLQFDKLPVALFNKDILYYEINNDYSSDMQQMSEIVYHRMVSRGVKQLVAIILRDSEGIPSGFICGINYSHKNIIYSELKECRIEIEKIYCKNND